MLNKMGGLVLALEFINWGGHNKLKPVIFFPKIGDYPPPPPTIRVRRVDPFLCHAFFYEVLFRPTSILGFCIREWNSVTKLKMTRFTSF